jgi:probable H4MPT-linked C1 transfer pathway protein
MDNQIIGWDVGGAHLKAALLDGDRKLLKVLQVPCPLWRGLIELEAAIETILNAFTNMPVLHAITMTGELVDLFANRKVGVQAISHVMDAKLNGTKQFYVGRTGLSASEISLSDFVTLQQVDDNWQYIASANWLASASFIGTLLQQQIKVPEDIAYKNIQHGLLIDIGSTTSDFVLLEKFKPVCLGFTDAERMQSEELIYSGVIRTPLMAVTQKIKFGKSVTSIAAEYFATTADVYRLTGDLQVVDDMADTADGQDKTELASARRIARMIGRDVEDAPISAWVELAQEFKLQQLMRLKAVAESHISRIMNDNQANKITIIGAGAGCFLAKEIASLLNLMYVDIAELIGTNIEPVNEAPSNILNNTAHWAGVCLPAVAVAYLAGNQSKLIIN